MGSRRSAQAICLFLFLQIAAFGNSFRLSTSSRWIVDQATGKRVKLTCANWASHLEPMIAEGLEKKPVSDIVGQIAAAGFNCVRFTWATFMYTRIEYGNLTVSQSLDKLGLEDAKAGIAKNNPQFLNMILVDVHQSVVNEIGNGNLMVVLDNHISQPQWCCSDGDGNGFFGDSSFDPNEWLQGLLGVASLYIGNPAVVAMSVRNELRGDRQNEDVWYQYMQESVVVVHSINPDILVIVSGLSYDSHLEFLKAKPFGVTIGNKLVFEAHWYTFGTTADEWEAQTNQACAAQTQAAENDYLFLIKGNNPFPLFLSEFGIDQRGVNEADNRYIICLLATAVGYDIDWSLWAFHGSYMLREGQVNYEENYGVMDLNWDRPRNPSFLDTLQLARRINQDSNSNQPTYNILYHPQSGQCAQVDQSNNLFLSNCNSASRWDLHQDGGPIKLAGNPQCLGVAGDGATAHVSNDCTSNGSQWKSVSSSGFHLAAQNGQGNYLCLERSAADSQIVTKKCLCVGDDLVDFSNCADNPQVQWFKFVPANV